MPSFPVASSYGRGRGQSTNGSSDSSDTVASNPEHLCCSGLAAEVAPPGIAIRDRKESLLDGRQPFPLTSPATSREVIAGKERAPLGWLLSLTTAAKTGRAMELPKPGS